LKLSKHSELFLRHTSRQETMSVPLSSKEQSLFKQVVQLYESKQYKRGAHLPFNIYHTETGAD